MPYTFPFFANSVPLIGPTNGIESGQLKTMIFNYIINLKRASKQITGKPKPGILSVNSIKYYVTGIQSFLEGLERIQYPSLIAAIFGGRSWEARK